MRVLLGSLAGGFMLFAWVLVSWGVLPFRNELAFREPTDDLEVHRVLSENLPQPGVYVSLRNLPDDPQLRSAFFDGPTFIIQHPGSGHEADLLESVLTLLVVLLAPLVPAVMLTFASPSVRASYKKRVAFIAGFGLFLALFAEPFQVAFGGQPPAFAAYLALHDVVGWILAGLAVAAIVGPAAAPKAAS